MSASHPAFQHLSRVYVQVPPSPHTMSSHRSAYNPSSSTNLKENAPLRPVNHHMSLEQSASASTSRKRKAYERDPSSLVLDGVVILSKKAKLSSGALKPTQMHADHSANDASNDGIKFTYCHQCNKKRDSEDTIRCTFVERFLKSKDKSIRERVCMNKYCKPCLTNRYDEDFDALKSLPAHEFKCPRCRDVCNCPRCRKSKGLEPVGTMSKLKATETDAPKKNKSSGPKSTTTTNSKPKPPKKISAKPLPVVLWTQIPTNLSYEEITQRILIREFFVRFGTIMDPPLGKTYLDELELIAGQSLQSTSDNEAEGWVSDMCVKAMTISLLGLLARTYSDEFAKALRNANKELRTAGANLNKIWATLSSLQDEIKTKSEEHSTTPGNDGDGHNFSLSAPGDLPPEIVDAHRNLRQMDAGLTVAVSSQMIHVVISIINHALTSRVIREDIEQASKDFKNWQPVVKNATKLENERWEIDKEAIISAKNKVQLAEASLNKAKRNLHKEQLENIENCMKIVAPYYAPRFTSLGFDDEQREYFALSPCVVECEAASEYLDVAASAKSIKCKKRGRVLPLEERRDLRDWSWFIGVYGCKPPGALNDGVPSASSDKSAKEDSDNGDGPRWWGFWDPEEITRLAEWITIKSGFQVENESPSNTGESESVATTHKAPLSPRDAQLKRLIAGLKDYSKLLQWRTSSEKCHLVKGSFAETQK